MIKQWRDFSGLPQKTRPEWSVPLSRRLNSLAAVLTNSRHCEWVIALGLASYTVIWTIYAAIAHGSMDIHFDMGEAVVWSHEITLGSPKHPPLSAWLAGAWFSVFPHQDWAFYLLSMTMASTALWFAWRISARYLPIEKRVAGLALLTLVPFFNFHALKFNANSVMIPLWAFATWAFLRSYETRKTTYAILAGIAAAAAMLGKYWAFFLLAGFAFAAMIDSRRGEYFRSAAPWVTIITGTFALALHLRWLLDNDFITFGYALTSHHGSVWQAMLSGPSYLLGALGYIAVPIGLAGLATHAGKAQWLDVIWPFEPERRMVLLVFALPLILPVLGAAATHSAAVSLWAMGSMTLLPVVLLSSPRLHISRQALVHILGTALALPVLAVLVSPIVAAVMQNTARNHMTHYQLLARVIEQVWTETTDTPLRLLGGDGAIANGAAFYAPGSPATLDVLNPGVTPWVDESRIAKQGIAWVCPLEQTQCVDAVEARTGVLPPGERHIITVARTNLFGTGKPKQYLIVTTPPQYSE